MQLDTALAEIDRFLCCPTPQAWVQAAPGHLPELLVDHANCEKKAASTALSLTYRYQLEPQALQALSKLAREELRHFEQVLAMMQTLDIHYRPLSASDYAGALRSAVSPQEPLRLIDTLLVCAIVEARSCERFNRLLAVLQGPLRDFYSKLLSSEARHYRLYLDLAARESRRLGVSPDLQQQRLAVLLAVDAESVQGESPTFRFHSGVYVPAEPVTA
ncbi:MAG: tRNA-(ms[2]io[6]A)-hydroxylase [Pseudomonadales bacterium]